jgi:hypothetical protein
VAASTCSSQYRSAKSDHEPRGQSGCAGRCPQQIEQLLVLARCVRPFDRDPQPVPALVGPRRGAGDQLAQLTPPIPTAAAGSPHQRRECRSPLRAPEDPRRALEPRLVLALEEPGDGAHPIVFGTLDPLEGGARGDLVATHCDGRQQINAVDRRGLGQHAHRTPDPGLGQGVPGTADRRHRPVADAPQQHRRLLAALAGIEVAGQALEPGLGVHLGQHDQLGQGQQLAGSRLEGLLDHQREATGADRPGQVEPDQRVRPSTGILLEPQPKHVALGRQQERAGTIIARRLVSRRHRPHPDARHAVARHSHRQGGELAGTGAVTRDPRGSRIAVD